MKMNPEKSDMMPRSVKSTLDMVMSGMSADYAFISVRMEGNRKEYFLMHLNILFIQYLGGTVWHLIKRY
jgi:hypothetical protein